MKAQLFIFIIGLMGSMVHAESLFSQEVVSLELKDVTIETLFTEIEKHTDYVFLYKADVPVEQRVSVKADNKKIKAVLEEVLPALGLEYHVSGKQILVAKARKEETTQQTPAQTKKKIIGVVTDINEEPLIGVSVMIKGTATGTITDMDGRYEIDAPEDAVLLFSFIGLEEQQIQVGKKNMINVVLQEDNQMMNEVIVVAYGTQKRLNVTGSVAAISSKQLQQSPVANISNALAGRLPGLISVQSNGEPGNDAAQIWIRGSGTYGSAQGPLIMVDGVERSYDNIDPNEIENIAILKDASSTAIYGVRGANGAVLITTKRGVEQKPKISVNLQSALQSPTRLPEYLDSYDALHLYQEGLINDGMNAAMYTDEYIAKYRDRSHPAYQYLYPNVDWQKELLKSHSMMHQANINVNGSNSFVRYFVSVSYLQQNGLYKYDNVIKDYDMQAKMNRYNFRSNIDITISKNLEMEVNLGGIIRDRNSPNVDNTNLWERLRMTPSWWYPVKNPDGSVAKSTATPLQNPFGMLTQSGYQRKFETSLQATTGFHLKLPWITQGLSLRGRLSFDALNYRDVTRAKGIYSYQFNIDENETDLTKGTYTNIDLGTNTLDYEVNANGNRKTVIELFLNYDRTFGEHDVKALVLYNQQSYMAHVGGGRNNAVNGLPYKYQGIVGRGAYAYRSKYFAEFNFGYNGSENFMKGNRFGFFPAFSAGWLVSGENFMKDYVPAVSLLKLRASAGVVGNDKVAEERFLYQGQWVLDAPGYQFGENSDGKWYPGAAESKIGNVAVTWERAKKYNLGVDLGLFKDALKLEVDLFYERRDQILTTPLTIPDILGIQNLPQINAGIVDNKGFEVVLTHQKHYGKFGYFARGNFSFARNKIVELTEPELSGREWQARTGRRIHEHMGLRAIGLFADWDDIASSPTQTFGAVQPGDIKYADLNGDGQIDEQDYGYLGRVQVPEAITGLALGFNIGNFDASVLFQGAFGAYVYYGGSAIYPFSQFAGVISEVKGNYFSAENPDVNALYPRMTSNANANNYRVSDFWHRKSDYVRLKNVEIGYSLSRNFLNKYGISTARIYLNGLNLITWSGLKTFDPEMPNEGHSYPQQKVFNVGLNLSF